MLPPGEWDPSIRIEPPKSVPSQVHSYDEICLNFGSNLDATKSGCVYICKYGANFDSCSWTGIGCLQEKRKMPGVTNGTACQVEEELHAEHHGPELQRTGR